MPFRIALKKVTQPWCSTTRYMSLLAPSLQLHPIPLTLTPPRLSILPTELTLTQPTLHSKREKEKQREDSHKVSPSQVNNIGILSCFSPTVNETEKHEHTITQKP